MITPHQRFLIPVVALAVTLAACGGGNATPKLTPSASVETVPFTATPNLPSATQRPIVTSTSLPSAIDPCTTRMSLTGEALSPGPSFALDANSKWQLCLGGVAAGSGEKFLFKTTNGGQAWTLISRTTLGNPAPEPGVGQLPNGNGVTQILFLDATHGWMGLSSPGVNLFRSQDGGVTWTEVPIIPPAVPVDSITFTDEMHGTVGTPQGTWMTTDGGVTWSH